MKVCSIDGCAKPVDARGWCHNHYERWRRRGTVEGWQPLSPYEKTMRATTITDSCWICTLEPSKDRPRLRDRNGELLAYRVVYEAVVGPIPPGAHLHHACHNKRCVNPDHLEPLSVSEHTATHHPRAELCSRGHDDWYDAPDGTRYCRSCHRVTTREYMRRQRAKSLPSSAWGM